MLKTLVEDFIDFTRMENATGIKIHKEPTDLKNLIETTKDIFEVQAEEKGLEFRTNIPEDLPSNWKTD